jgi:hypothetical protein
LNLKTSKSWQNTFRTLSSNVRSKNYGVAT